ncbi:MAG: N4-gp56 family major capsid protein [Eubacterium sp.]|nr:N4-gp56 family major capsid protein [Eubacterium sp.]
MTINVNLRQFDDMTAVQTTGLLTNEMKTFYESTLIDVAEPKLVHDRFADKYPIPKNNGKSIEFRKYSPLAKASEPLTEGVTPKGNSLSVSTITATVDQYGDYIRLSDMLELSAIDNNVVQSTKLLGGQAGRTLDTVTREVINAGTNVIYAPKADGTEIKSRATLTADCALTVDLVFQAAAALEAMNADGVDGESYVAIIHPYVAYDLMRSDEWVDVHKYADPDSIFKGEIGCIGNVRFVKSTEAKIFKDGTCPDGLAVFSTLVFGAHAFAVTDITGGGLQHIIKQLGYGDDPLNQRSSVGWKAVKTAKILSDEYLVRIESCSPDYSAKVNAN